jgi:predicted acyl esterase
LEQVVDFADRSTQMSLYASDAIESKLDFGQVLQFVSNPFDAPVTVDGMMSGELKATINKKDMDVTLAFYEWMPDGRYFRLGYYLGRASYAHDATTRKLLTPGKLASIPFEHTPLVSRQLQKGSRLVVLLTVNKSAWSQVNYGTGKDVSDESAKDASEPLIVSWHNDSFVNFPISGKGQLGAGAD